MSTEGRTALVTGATGFVGAFLTERLIREGRTVCCLARAKVSRSGEWIPATDRVFAAIYSVNPAFDRSRLVVVEGDCLLPGTGVRPADILNTLGRVNELWHCAAMTSFDDLQREQIWRTNVVGTQNTIELAKGLGAENLLFCSTAYVADRMKLEAEEQLVPRSVDHANVYEESKSRSEYDLATSNVPHIVLRLPVLTGRRSDGKTRQFMGFYVFARLLHRIRDEVLERFNLLEERRVLIEEGFSLSTPDLAVSPVAGPIVNVPVTVQCAPDDTVNILPIDQAVDTMLLVADHRPTDGTILHVTNGRPPTIRSLFESAGKALGISGIDLDPDPQLGSREEPRTIRSYNRMISRGTDTYSPYLSGEPSFVRTALEAAVGSSNLPSFDCDEYYIRMLIDYAVAKNWGLG